MYDCGRLQQTFLNVCWPKLNIFTSDILKQSDQRVNGEYFQEESCQGLLRKKGGILIV